jgi:hypothetical protein
MKQYYYSSSITRLVWVIVVLASFHVETSEAQLARRADSVKNSFVGTWDAFEKWIADPTKQKFGTLKEAYDGDVRYIAIPTDLGINSEVRNFWDLDPKPYGGAPPPAPRDTVLYVPPSRTDEILSLQPMSLFTAFENAYYIRFEFERHTFSDSTTEYPGFLSHSGLTGTDDTVNGTSPAFLIGTSFATSKKSIRLKTGTNTSGVFADSMWCNSIFDGPPNGDGPNGNHPYFAQNVGGTAFNRKMLMRMRVKIDDPVTGTPTLCIIKRIETTNKGVIRTTHFDTIKVTNTLFKNIASGFDTIDIRYIRDADHYNPDPEAHSDQAQCVFFSFSWPGTVNATFDYLELMTAHINPGDDSAQSIGGYANIDSSEAGAYSGEDFLAEHPVELGKLISSIKQKYLGHINYIRIGDEFASMHGLPFKRLVKLMRDSTDGKIEIMPYTVDSNRGWFGHAIPQAHEFNFEGARRGWVNPAIYGDPKQVLFDPYMIGTYIPLPRRTTDTANLSDWELEHMIRGSFRDGSGLTHPSASHYTRDEYIKQSQFAFDGPDFKPERGYRYFLLGNRMGHRWAERQGDSTHYGIVWQAGAGSNYQAQTQRVLPVVDPDNPIDTLTGLAWGYFSGLRPPTGPEMKVTGHLATSCGASGLILYLLGGPAPIGGGGENGGIMASDGNHDSMLYTHKLISTADTLTTTLWLGFKERYDTMKTLIPLLIKYGTVLLHSKYLGDWTAGELPNITDTNIKNLLPFKFNTLKALDDDLHHDTLRANNPAIHDFTLNEQDTSNRTFVHVSLWVDTLDNHNDTMLYITNMRTDDSWDTSGVPSTMDRRFITLQMKRQHIAIDMVDTLGAQLDSGRLWTPFVGRQSTDSLKVLLYPGDGILVKLLDTLQGNMVPMRIAIDYPKGGGDFNDHGRIRFDRPVPGVLDKSNSAKWSIPSSSRAYTVGISDTTTVKMWQDSLLYHTIHSSRPKERWRQQNWTEQTTPTSTQSFSYKKQLARLPAGINQRRPFLSLDSIAHNIVITTDMEGTASLGKVRFFDPFLVDTPSLANRNTILDTVPRLAPFLPHSIPSGTDIGADSAHYGGVYLMQNARRADSIPIYSLNAFNTIRSGGSHNSLDTLPNYGDWTFLEWEAKDTVVSNDIAPWKSRLLSSGDSLLINTNKSTPVVFGKDSAIYVARYKAHMATFSDTAGLDYNGQRKLCYLITDSLERRWYRTVYASNGMIFSAVGYQDPSLLNSMIWNPKEELISEWKGGGFTFAHPALTMHFNNYDTIARYVYEAIPDSGGGNNMVKLTTFKPQDTNKTIVTRDLGIDADGTSTTKEPMPVIASAEGTYGPIDVVAWVVDSGIVVKAGAAIGADGNEIWTDGTHSNPFLRFGDVTATHPTIWMDTCRKCTNDSSLHHIVLAWQQDTAIASSTRPGGHTIIGGVLPCTDIMAVEFEVKYSKFAPFIVFENIGTPVDVSYTVDNDSYDNRNPCISGARYKFSQRLVRIAYENRRDSGGPSQGIEVAHLREGFGGWKRTVNINTNDTITDLFKRPSIEVTRYHDTLNSQIPMENYYSLAFERSGGITVRHLAMDSDMQRASAANFFLRKRPQLAVTRQKIDSDICQVTLTVSASPLFLYSGHDGFYKESAERHHYTQTEGKLGLYAVPNPTRGDVNISFSLPDDGEVELTVFDQLGKEVARMTKLSTKGDQQYLWRPQNLPPGVYSVVVHFGNFEQVIRVAYIP